MFKVRMGGIESCISDGITCIRRIVGVFYLPEGKKEIAFEVDNALVMEFNKYLAAEESYLVMVDVLKKQVI